MADQNEYEPPHSDPKDTAHAIAKAGLGSIPIVGAAAAELFQLVVTPSLERRRVEWMEAVAEGLKRLEEQGHRSFEELASDESFVDAVLQASHIAMRNSSEEKQKALRSAILNSALPSAPDESRRQMFLSWVDDLTVWHLRILTLLANPLRWFENANKPPPQYALTSSLSELICDAYPEMRNQRAFYDQIGKDLHGRGLIGTDSFHTMMSAGGAFQQRASDLGKQFIDFVSARTE